MEQQKCNENKTPTFVLEWTIFAFAGWSALVIFIYARGIFVSVDSRTQRIFGLWERGEEVRGGREYRVVQSAGDYDVWRPVVGGRAICQGSVRREIQGKVLDVLLRPDS